MVTINEVHKALSARDAVRGRFRNMPVCAVVLANGYKLSVQASSSHSSALREGDAWPYTAFEVLPLGFDDATVIHVLGRDPDDSGVYGWVPADAVERLIHAGGGYDVSWLAKLLK